MGKDERGGKDRKAGEGAVRYRAPGARGPALAKDGPEYEDCCMGVKKLLCES